MSVLDELQEQVQDAARQVGPAVVGIGTRRALGSGVVVASGKVLTNAHNIRADEATVTFSDGREATGKTEGVDVDGDIAVLSVDTGDISPAEWAASVAPEPGAAVVALANPGGRGLRVTFGLVSGTQRTFRGPRGRRITGSLEHTAPLLPGSSGGPVVDRNGKLLGVNTNRLGDGFYLAIPADQALRDRVDALARGESPHRRRLGVGVAPSHVARGLRRAVGLPEAEGLLVRQVEENSPAAAGGMQEGDLIVAVGGTPVADFDALSDAMESQPAGAVTIRILRGTEEREVSVDLGKE
jgi:S1-C subfamily serine protease